MCLSLECAPCESSNVGPTSDTQFRPHLRGRCRYYWPGAARTRSRCLPSAGLARNLHCARYHPSPMTCLECSPSADRTCPTQRVRLVARDDVQAHPLRDRVLPNRGAKQSAGPRRWNLGEPLYLGTSSCGPGWEDSRGESICGVVLPVGRRVGWSRADVARRFTSCRGRHVADEVGMWPTGIARSRAPPPQAPAGAAQGAVMLLQNHGRGALFTNVMATDCSSRCAMRPTPAPPRRRWRRSPVSMPWSRSNDLRPQVAAPVPDRGGGTDRLRCRVYVAVRSGWGRPRSGGHSRGTHWRVHFGPSRAEGRVVQRRCASILGVPGSRRGGRPRADPKISRTAPAGAGQGGGAPRHQGARPAARCCASGRHRCRRSVPAGWGAHSSRARY